MSNGKQRPEVQVSANRVGGADVSGWDAYGLRRAKRHVRDLRRKVVGDRSPAADGYRRALRELEQLCNDDLTAIKASL